MEPIPFWPARPARIWPGQLFEKIARNPLWTMEPKLDGFRVIVAFQGGQVKAWTRHGKPQALKPETVKELLSTNVPDGTVIDGELLGSHRSAGTPERFVAFDCPVYKRRYDTASPLDRRRGLMASLGLPVIEQAPRDPSSFEAALKEGHEGLVLKRLDVPYPFAHGPTTETNVWLKIKGETANGRLQSRAPRDK